MGTYYSTSVVDVAEASQSGFRWSCNGANIMFVEDTITP